jgi:hypothetical protein
MPTVNSYQVNCQSLDYLMIQWKEFLVVRSKDMCCVNDTQLASFVNICTNVIN